MIQDEKKHFTPKELEILLQPEEKTLRIPYVKTVRQLLSALGLQEEDALIAREGKLLTHDQRLFPNETILVRQVASRG